MRRLINLYKKDNTKLTYDGGESYYTYNEYDDLVPVIDIDTESGIIISNGRNLRERTYIINGLKETANEILSKQQKMNSFPLAKITDFQEGILVGQGPDTPPIWKTFDSVFPSNIYEVHDGESLRIEGINFTPSEFRNSDATNYIYNGSFINKLTDYQLETKRLVNPYNFYSSMRNEITFIPVKALVNAIDGNVATNDGNLHEKIFVNSFTIDSDYELDMQNEFVFYVYNRLKNSLKMFSAPGESVTAIARSFAYKFFIPLDFQTEEGDDILYMGNVVTRSSLTDKNEYITNYIINKIDTVTPIYSYETEIKGDANSISANIPVNIDVESIDLGKHHGFYIDMKNNLNGFGIEYKGELTNVPIGKYTEVACGLYHNVAINDSEELVSWGSDDFDQITNTPNGKFKKVYAFDNVSAAISINNELFIWGESVHYDIDFDIIMNDIVDVALGERFIIALRTDGKIIGQGDDTYGQISNIPTGTFTKITAGRYHCTAVSEDMAFYAWGSDNERQLDKVDTIVEKVIDIVSTDFGGGVVTENHTFKSFGKIDASGTQTYQRIVSGSDNIVLLKNGVMNIEHVYKGIEITGDAFNMRFDIDVPNVVLNKIHADLDVLN